MQDLKNDDCFAFQKDTQGHVGCYCLSKLYCKSKACRFYKPKTEISITEIEEAVSNYAQHSSSGKKYE